MTLKGVQSYFDGVMGILNTIFQTQEDALEQATARVVQTLQAGGVIYLFGTGHSHMLAEEGHYRAGGLASVVPILDESLMLHQGAVESTRRERTAGIAAELLARYRPTPDDVLFVFSNSGVNAVPVEMALAGKASGVTVIAVVARQYEAAAPTGVTGKKLSEVADVVIDNGGVQGDAIIAIGDKGVKVGPTSTISGAFILNAVLVEAAHRLNSANIPVPAYISANVPGSHEHNQSLIARYRERNPHL